MVEKNTQNVEKLKMERPLVLIIDDDEQLCKMFQIFLFSNGVNAKALNDPHIALKELQKETYHAVLLDVIMPTMNGLDVLGEIRKNNPGTKVIIMTGYADKEIAIKAIKMGAYDFLEKPVTIDLLNHTVRRALDNRKTEIERETALGELKRKNQELIRMNEALTELVKVIEMIRQTTEKRIIQQIWTLVVPIVDYLKGQEALEQYEPQFTMLIGYIENIASGIAVDLQANHQCSPMELRVALMVKNGMKNQAIAQHLHISLETVKAHRRNIRKKLGLTGTKNSLGTYLGTYSGELRT
jgi:FixJ family two-component response regulator